jgi:hypothetical protein
VVRSCAIAVIAVLPAVAMADRPRVRPHHHISAKGRKILAAHRFVSISFDYPGSSSGYSGAGSYSYGASMSSMVVQRAEPVFQVEAAVAAAGAVKTGAGTTTLSGTLNLGSGGTGTTSVVNGALTTNSSVVQNAVSAVNLVAGNLGTTVPGNLAIVGGENALAVGGATLNLTATGTPLNIVGNGTLILNPVSVSTAGSILTLTSATLSAPVPVARSEGFNQIAPESPEGPAPVPEPSSALLAFLGAGWLVQRRWRV